MYNDFVGGQVVLIELQGWEFPAATNANTHGDCRINAWQD